MRRLAHGGKFHEAHYTQMYIPLYICICEHNITIFTWLWKCHTRKNRLHWHDSLLQPNSKYKGFDKRQKQIFLQHTWIVVVVATQRSGNVKLVTAKKMLHYSNDFTYHLLRCCCRFRAILTIQRKFILFEARKKKRKPMTY